MGFLVNDFVGRSENPFFYEHNAKMNSNLSGEVIDVESWWDGWFDLNWGEPGFPGTVPRLVALAVPRWKLLQVEWAPYVPKPGEVYCLSNTLCAITAPQAGSFLDFHSVQCHSVTTVALNCCKISNATQGNTHTHKHQSMIKIWQSVSTSIDVLVVLKLIFQY